MTTANAPHPAVVALPPAAVTAEEWVPDGARFYRCFEGEERETPTDARHSNTFAVFAGGVQWSDGTIEDGSTAPCMDAPRVYLSEVRENGVHMDGVPMSADAARRLADLLVTAADECDGW